MPERQAYVVDPTFGQWLYHVREDPRFSELAAFAYDDRGCFPYRARTVETVLEHLATHHAKQRSKPSATSVEEAFAAYERQRARVKIPRRIGAEPLPAERRRQLHSYLVAPETHPRLEELKALLFEPEEHASLGRVLDVAVEELYERVKRRRRSG